MAEKPTAPDDVKLSKHTTVFRYRELQAAEDRTAIVRFLRERFGERYIDPLDSMTNPHGFIIMAICCLLIEALQAFRSGWQEVVSHRKKPYREFFREYGEFGVSTVQADELYDHIRSGILHLGETTGGWRVRRKGKLLDFESRIVNARLFKEKVVACFEQYCEKLERSPWTAEVWVKFRDRMGSVLRNCVAD